MSTVMPTTACVEGDFSIYKGNCNRSRTRLGLFKNMCEIHAKTFDFVTALPGRVTPEARGTKKIATFKAAQKPKKRKRVKKADGVKKADARIGTHKKKNEERRDDDENTKDRDKKKKKKKTKKSGMSWMTDIRTLFSPPRSSENKREKDPVYSLSSSDEDEDEEKKKKRERLNNPIILNYTCCDGHSVTVKKKDLKRLNDGRMLNDTLIDFYMKYLSTTFRDKIPDLESRIFIFSTYFYTKLTENGFNYDNVSRWTRKTNLFEDLSFVFIPINESGHWSLAIISIDGGRFSVLHLDALSMHDTNRIGRNLLRYLRNE